MELPLDCTSSRKKPPPEQTSSVIGTTTGTNQLSNWNHQRNRQLDERKHRQTTPAQPKLIPIFTQIFSTKGAKTNNQINNQPKYKNKNLLFTISHNVQ